MFYTNMNLYINFDHENAHWRNNFDHKVNNCTLISTINSTILHISFDHENA